MSRDLKPTERLVQIGQTALRAPDGSFLPAQPLYIIVEAAPDEPQDKLFSAGEEQLMTTYPASSPRSLRSTFRGSSDWQFTLP